MKNWFKEYWVYVAIAIFGGIIGTALSLTIWHQNNIGTLADWVSGIGSVVAIVFAYWQIDEQRKEYEEDRNYEKEKEKFSNRAYFGITYGNYVNEGEKIVYNWNYCISENLFDYNSDKKIFFVNETMTGNSLIIVKNYSSANAINCLLKVEYNDNSSDTFDFENLQPGDKKTIIPNKLIDKPSSHIPQLINSIEIHFDSIRNEHFVQRWDKKGMNNMLDLSDSEINDAEKENNFHKGSYYCLTET